MSGGYMARELNNIRSSIFFQSQLCQGQSFESGLNMSFILLQISLNRDQARDSEPWEVRVSTQNLITLFDFHYLFIFSVPAMANNTGFL